MPTKVFSVAACHLLMTKCPVEEVTVDTGSGWQRKAGAYIKKACKAEPHLS